MKINIEFNRLIELNILHIPNMAEKMFPEIPKNQAASKLRNKINKVNGNRLTENDYQLIKEVLK